MNRGRKLKQLHKFILKYGKIDDEYKRPPDKSYQPYRKGSYFATFNSDQLGLSCSIGNVNKYRVYKDIANEIKDLLHKKG